MISDCFILTFVLLLRDKNNIDYSQGGIMQNIESSLQVKINVDLFVAIASVSAELASVTTISRQISLSAKNAKAIAARAGNKALGFRPITDFIDEVAVNIAKLVSGVDHETVKLSRLAIANFYVEDAAAKVNTTLNKLNRLQETDTDNEELIQFLDKSIDLQETVQMQYRRQMNELLSLLEETNTQLQSAEMICTTSRTEATRAGEFQSSLEVVADEVAHSVEKVKKILRASRLCVIEASDRMRMNGGIRYTLGTTE